MVIHAFITPRVNVTGSTLVCATDGARVTTRKDKMNTMFGRRSTEIRRSHEALNYPRESRAKGEVAQRQTDARTSACDYITKVWTKVQRAVGERLAAAELGPLPRLTVHELRHSHATILLRAGVPVHIVAKRLGHKDASVTLNVYADVIPDDDTSAVDVFSQVVWGAGALADC